MSLVSRHAPLFGSAFVPSRRVARVLSRRAHRRDGTVTGLSDGGARWQISRVLMPHAVGGKRAGRRMERVRSVEGFVG